jgi:hypothetical protein
MSLITVPTVCTRCSDRKEFVLELERFERWKGGEHIQRAFPNLSPEDRERLITGICPVCWDNIFENVE